MAYTTIDKPTDYFNTVLYTGNGGTQSITGVGFQPDWVWYKNRSASANHGLFDAVRGATKLIQSNNTGAEQTVSGVTSFNSDGFGIGADSDGNGNGNNIVAWNWKAGTSFTNDASSTGIGSIDSSGSVNTDAGFSICSYTGTGSAGTIKHGLSATPKMIIAKNRSDGGQLWAVYHASLSGANKYLSLNSTSSEQGGTAIWNSTHPTSSIFSVAGHGTTNENGDNHIAYCFAEKKGYSKFGSYTGNGNADGTFVYTGFKPAWLLAKKSSGTGDWFLIDNKRSTINPTNHQLEANSSAAEDASGRFDFLSNGFKCVSDSTGSNGSGTTYIYMAFSENPFVTSTGVPATAR